MSNCIFCKIVNRELPKKLVYEDNDVVVFPDIHPVRPVHLLVVPKKHVKDFLAFSDDGLFAKLGRAIQKIVREHGLDREGYRLIVNGGGAQIIDHLHVHVVGPMEKEVPLH